MSQGTMSPAERIRELSAINADVPAMLSAAGMAVSALTNKAPDNHNSHDETSGTDGGDGSNAGPSVAARKQVFTEKAKEYLTLAQSISALLRRQAYALEEAGINAAEAPVISTTSSFNQESAQRGGPGAPTGMPRRGGHGLNGASMSQRQPADDGDRVTNGGLGKLDVGLLNSRGNSVGLEKEAELVAEAKELLTSLVNPSQSSQKVRAGLAGDEAEGEVQDGSPTREVD